MAQSQRKFYRTVYEVEVYSETPYPHDARELAEIDYDITDGDCNGSVKAIVVNEESDAYTTAQALMASGSDTTFFGLTEDGEDVER
jgi:hypothetical protein